MWPVSEPNEYNLGQNPMYPATYLRITRCLHYQNARHKGHLKHHGIPMGPRFTKIPDSDLSLCEFKVIRCQYWWHVRLPQVVPRFHSLGIIPVYSDRFGSQYTFSTNFTKPLHHVLFLNRMANFLRWLTDTQYPHRFRSKLSTTILIYTPLLEAL